MVIFWIKGSRHLYQTKSQEIKRQNWQQGNVLCVDFGHLNGDCVGCTTELYPNVLAAQESLDASGTCCKSGDVDECGVCDGRGTTCLSRVVFRVSSELDNQDLESCIKKWSRRALLDTNVSEFHTKRKDKQDSNISRWISHCLERLRMCDIKLTDVTTE